MEEYYNKINRIGINFQNNFPDFREKINKKVNALVKIDEEFEFARTAISTDNPENIYISFEGLHGL